MSHHAYSTAGPFPFFNDDKDNIVATDDRKIDDNKSDNSINDKIDKIENDTDRKSHANKILAASITYKDEDILRAIGGPSLR